MRAGAPLGLRLADAAVPAAGAGRPGAADAGRRPLGARARVSTRHRERSGPPPILMNIGDLLSYWTNGLLRSTVHRVVFPRFVAVLGRPGRRRGPTRTRAIPSPSSATPPTRPALTPVPSERVAMAGRCWWRGEQIGPWRTPMPRGRTAS